jgi:toxin ParE1/3/4
MGVKWTRTALANLNDLAEYIAQDNPRAAAEMVDRIVAAIEKLKTHPSLGRPGRVPNTRELVVAATPYIIPYRVKGRNIEILRVFHGARRWPEDF